MDDVPISAPRPAPLAQPLSFGGVAAIAGRSVWCLLAWQLTVALLAGVAWAWALGATWGQAWSRAAQNLPDRAAIRGGRLDWPGVGRAILHQGPFVAFVVEPAGLRESVLASDVTVYLESDGAAFRSLLGWAAVPYPQDLSIPLGRLEMGGTLAAWGTPAFLLVAGSVALALILVWWALSFAYGAILWACASVLGRRAGFATAWRTAGGALLAPALLMTAAVLLYATRSLTFVGFVLALPLHLVAGWLYCAGGLTHLPAASPPESNPFDTRPPAPASKPAVPADANPFHPT